MKGHAPLAVDRDFGIDADMRFPSQSELAEALASAPNSGSPDELTVIGHIRFDSSTYAAGIMKCRLAGVEVDIFCKYSPNNPVESYGHRGGVDYEAKVYEHALVSLRMNGIPHYYGAYRDPQGGETWLLTEYLRDTTPVTWVYEPRSHEAAASWLGTLHAISERSAEIKDAGVVRSYDFEYYNGWAIRTAEFASHGRLSYPWLAAVCENFEGVIPVLLNEEKTLIHGEFYGKNILVRNEEIFAVDWESAAIGAGEIDLAALTDNWPKEWRAKAESAYTRARWPADRPDDFERRLDVARLYLVLRWLGDRPEWTLHPEAARLFEQLRFLGSRLDLI